MAETHGTQRRGSEKKNDGRDRLAQLVVVASFLTLFLIVVAFLALAQGSNKDAATAGQNVFNAILPVLAGWVGTVLAFYFSSASQERASESLDKVIKQSGVAGGSDISVSEKMIPVLKITRLLDLGVAPPEKILLLDSPSLSPPLPPLPPPLQKIFNDEKLPNGAAITRLVFIQNGVFKYVLHSSTLNAFLLDTATAKGSQATANPPPPAGQPAPPPAGQPAPPPAGTGPTFADMLKNQDLLTQISKLVVFVSSNATLADAKAALDKVVGAQDIIVTASGNSTDPMLGWLSNIDLGKALQTS